MIGGLVIGPIAASGGGGGGSPGAGAPGAFRFWRILNANDNESALLAEQQLREYIGSPTLTSGGASIADKEDGGAKENAHDGGAGTVWQGFSGAGRRWIGYDFGAGIAHQIGEVVVQAPSTNFNLTIRNFDVQYSSDGVTWFTAWTVSGQSTFSASEVRTFSAPYATPDPDQSVIRANRQTLYAVQARRKTNEITVTKQRVFVVLET